MSPFVSEAQLIATVNAFQARPWPAEARAQVEDRLHGFTIQPRAARLWSGTLTREGRCLTVMRLNAQMYVVEEGQLWVFFLEETPTDIVPDDAMWAAYLAHRSAPEHHAAPAPWHLEVDDRFELPLDAFSSLPGHFSHFRKETFPAWLDRAYDPLERALMWVREDLAWLQQDAGLTEEDVVSPPFLKDAYWVKRGQQSQGQTADQVAQALAQHYAVAIQKAFQNIRRAMPVATRRALRHAGSSDGALAHWLNEGGAPRRLALIEQPYLLPVALQIGGQWPVALPEEATAQLSLARQLGNTLTERVDAGESIASDLLALINLSYGEARLLPWTQHGAWDEIPHPDYRGHFQIDDVEAMAKLSAAPFHQVLLKDRVGLSHQWSELLLAFQGLPEEQRPRTKTGLVRLKELVQNLGNNLARHPTGFAWTAWYDDHLAGFLEGVDLDHDTDWDERWSRWGALWDLNRRLGLGQRDTPWSSQMFARLSWRQWDQMVQEAFLEDRQDSGRAWTWYPATRYPRMTNEEGQHIHELTSTQALNQAIERLGAGQAWWAQDAALGLVRLFELTDEDGQSQALVRVSIHRQRVIQVMVGPQGNPPSDASLAAFALVVSQPQLWWRAPFVPAQDAWETREEIAFDRAFSAAFRLRHPPKPGEPTEEDLKARSGLFVTSTVIG